MTPEWVYMFPDGTWRKLVITGRAESDGIVATAEYVVIGYWR